MHIRESESKGETESEELPVTEHINVNVHNSENLGSRLVLLADRRTHHNPPQKWLLNASTALFI